jgi:hypothetical protein
LSIFEAKHKGLVKIGRNEYSSEFEEIIKRNKKIFFNNEVKFEKKSVIENPIFIDTKIPGILDPHMIYTNIADYIASKADFNIVDTRNDVQKAVDHGFDKKTSFRNM